HDRSRLRQARRVNDPPFEDHLQGETARDTPGGGRVGPFEMNSERPPEGFGLVLEVGWDYSGPDGTIDLEVDVDHKWLTHICVDSGSGADADHGKAGRQAHRLDASSRIHG